MVVEDDVLLNQTLAEILSGVGCSVLQAFDGLQAFELACQHHPALMVLDLDLPRVYGQVLMRILRSGQVATSTRFVVLTARAELLRDEDRTSAFAVLEKPADLDEFVGTVEAALHTSLP
jgi:DNA-binding response OmpR family regulator